MPARRLDPGRVHSAPGARLAVTVGHGQSQTVAVGAAQRQTVAVGPSRPTGPLGPTNPNPNSSPNPDADQEMDGKGFQKLVWLFMQMLNLSTHIWVVFLAAFLHLDLGKAAPAGYFELGAGLDVCLLLLGLGQAFVDSSYSSEITCWTIFCTSALNLPSHLWYISGDKMEVMRHTLAVLRPGMALSIDKLTGYLDVSCHVIATSAILNEVFASAYGMSTVLCIVSSAALVSSIACLGSLRLLHPALEHIDKDRTQRQKLTRTASMDTLYLAMKKKRARE